MYDYVLSVALVANQYYFYLYPVCCKVDLVGPVVVWLQAVMADYRLQSGLPPATRHSQVLPGTMVVWVLAMVGSKWGDLSTCIWEQCKQPRSTPSFLIHKCPWSPEVVSTYQMDVSVGGVIICFANSWAEVVEQMKKKKLYLHSR